jgi:hypothetical protein
VKVCANCILLCLPNRYFLIILSIGQ